MSEFDIKKSLEAIEANTKAARDNAEAAVKQADALVKEAEARINAEFAEQKAKMEAEIKELKAASAARQSIPLFEGADTKGLTPTGMESKAARMYPAAQKADTRDAQTRAAARKAMEKYIRFGLTGVKGQLTPEESKALAESVDSQGGYLVAPDLESGIITVAAQIAEVRTVADARPTGRDRVWMSKLTALPTVAWGQENVQVSDQTLKYGLEELDINVQTVLVLLSNDLLEDTDADVFGHLTDAVGLKIAESEDFAFSNGSGAQQPLGFFTQADIQNGAFVTATVGTMVGDDLINAFYKNLKKVYRRNATFGMSSQIEAAVRTFKDSNGQYLWQINPFTSLKDGAPTTILGRPVINTEGNSATVATGQFPIIVGDFQKGYAIRDRRGLTIQRLNERYADFRQTGFLVTRRVGGQPVLAEAFAAIKVK